MRMAAAAAATAAAAAAASSSSSSSSKQLLLLLMAAAQHDDDVDDDFYYTSTISHTGLTNVTAHFHQGDTAYHDYRNIPCGDITHCFTCRCPIAEAAASLRKFG